ncbi:Ser/Thr phosphatase family protein [Acanthamoeba castellanii str. Neff]|uniref:Ser/Thr phosphatase family protein n=1 Tax=Acanthamoeba castellanii (strain ATCC 30010 / Neff) TaxID=1257118 RepID=L8GJ60_ACACF|nr:Ser/Thr phosphatase family protein [Acanthamoeba castellanii str. Neff]ELR12216.1 Ser/Thr phosphatase family protein [Acanthamoeba castellanii str. Neff]
MEATAPEAGSGAKQADVFIWHFNDVYEEPVGGAARFATALRAQAASKPLVLFSGDVFNPSLMSTVTKGKHMVPILNELGVHCSVFGNHDFDFGVDTLVKYSNQCKFPWLMSNVNLSATHQPLASGLKTHLMEWNGVKIGLVGLVEEDWLQTIVNLPPVEFLDFVLEGRRLASELRAQGAQLVVALTHMRMPNAEKLAQEVKEIDLVLNGHDHFYEVRKADETGTWIINSGTDFRNATVVRIFLSDGHPPRFELERVDITKRFEEDAAVKKIVQEYSEELETRLQKVIGWAGNCRLEKSFLIDVVSKIYVATDSSPVDMQTYELCSDMIDVVIDVSCIYGMKEDSDGLAYDDKSQSLIKLSNGMVLYLREVNKCENFDKHGLLNYNFQCLKQSITEVFQASNTAK